MRKLDIENNASRKVNTLRSAEQSLVCACAWIIAACASVAEAQEPVHYEVRARIDAADGIVDADVDVEVALAAQQTEVRLWVYADRLSVEPHGITEMSARWIYAGEVDLGVATVDTVRVDGAPANARNVTTPDREASGSQVVVSVAAGPERHVHLTFHAHVEVPARFGRLGRDADFLSLQAPWYPIVVDEREGWDYRVPHHVVIDAGSDEVALVDELTHETTHVGAYVPAFVAPELYAYDRDVLSTRVRVMSPRELYTPPSASAVGEQGIVDLVRVDEVSLIAQAFRHTITTLRSAGLSELVHSLNVVFVPSRIELTSTADSNVTVSERIYEVLPIEQALAFHERALMRAMFRALVRPISTRFEGASSRPWADDMRAALLIDVDDARRHGHVLTPAELIGFAAFHPAVDQILYAPQIQFADAFFGSVDEADIFRDDPMRAFAPIARGRRLLESARDALADDEFAEFAHSLLHEERSVVASLSAVNASIAARLPEWLTAPAQPVNYRLVSAESIPSPDGGFTHRVVVEREGAQRLEPVDVRVEDENGNLLNGVWDGAGPRGTVELHSDSPLHDVLVDPSLRLTDNGDLTDGHPRADNATSNPWRPPLMSSFNISYAASESRVDGNLGVVMRRRYDLEHSFMFELNSDAMSTGGMVRYIWGVGRKRDNNNRIGALSVAADISRLRAGYIEGSQPGWQASVYLFANLDTRVFVTDPRRGATVRAALRFGGVQAETGGLEFSASASARASYAVPIGLLNVLHLFVGGGVTVGDAFPGQFQSLGGRYLLRGFESGELVGRARFYAVAEHRWTAIRDLDWNFLNLAWVREIQLAAFAGAGVVIDDVATGSTQLAADAGGGMRIHFQYAGVQPGVMSIDVAAPLTRSTNDVVYNGVVVRERQPASFYVAFDQYF